MKAQQRSRFIHSKPEWDEHGSYHRRIQKKWDKRYPKVRATLELLKAEIRKQCLPMAEHSWEVDVKVPEVGDGRVDILADVTITRVVPPRVITLDFKSIEKLRDSVNSIIIEGKLTKD